MNCPKHPDRPVVDQYVCTTQFCSECVQRHLDNYADPKVNVSFGREYEYNRRGYSVSASGEAYFHQVSK